MAKFPYSKSSYGKISHGEIPTVKFSVTEKLLHTYKLNFTCLFQNEPEKKLIRDQR